MKPKKKMGKTGKGGGELPNHQLLKKNTIGTAAVQLRKRTAKKIEGEGVK